MDNSKTRYALAAIVLVALAAAVFFAIGYFRSRAAKADLSLLDIDSAQLDGFLASGQPGVVEFYTTTCPWCTKLEPELAKVEAEYDGRLFVVKMNAQKHYAESARYSIKVVPTMVFFNELGSVESTVEGFMEAPDIIGLIKGMGIAR